MAVMMQERIPRSWKVKVDETANLRHAFGMEEQDRASASNLKLCSDSAILCVQVNQGTACIAAILKRLLLGRFA